MLNKGITFFMDNHSDYRFSVPRYCLVVSHNLFADDTLVLCNGFRRVIKTVFHVIANNEMCSGQKLISPKMACSAILLHQLLGFSL